jgi:hypothetical protein
LPRAFRLLVDDHPGLQVVLYLTDFLAGMTVAFPGSFFAVHSPSGQAFPRRDVHF